MTYWWFLPLYNTAQNAVYCCLIPFSFGTSRYIHMCVWRQPWLLNRSHIKLLLHTFSDPFGPSTIRRQQTWSSRYRVATTKDGSADIMNEFAFVCGPSVAEQDIGSRTGHCFRLMSLLICWCSYSQGLDKVNRLKGGGLLTKLAQIKISFAVNR